MAPPTSGFTKYCRSCGIGCGLRKKICGSCGTHFLSHENDDLSKRRSEGARCAQGPEYSFRQLRKSAAYAYGAGWATMVVAVRKTPHQQIKIRTFQEGFCEEIEAKIIKFAKAVSGKHGVIPYAEGNTIEIEVETDADIEGGDGVLIVRPTVSDSAWPGLEDTFSASAPQSSATAPLTPASAPQPSAAILQFPAVAPLTPASSSQPPTAIPQSFATAPLAPVLAPQTPPAIPQLFASAPLAPATAPQPPVTIPESFATLPLAPTSAPQPPVAIAQSFATSPLAPTSAPQPPAAITQSSAAVSHLLATMSDPLSEPTYYVEQILEERTIRGVKHCRAEWRGCQDSNFYPSKDFANNKAYIDFKAIKRRKKK